ncbi:hypothetical protein ABE29_23015 [Cytobacillus firmus]|nr:hypothetical protein [Cytobacillus firmus]MBG9551171.1 hypothetical protein [Cytobacillus firmus]MBG9557953.1 hypothetical protein [Cytobacillus firmus]MBG9577577.1 hypothetical protein [Cytobacillus firmus]
MDNNLTPYKPTAKILAHTKYGGGTGGIAESPCPAWISLPLGSGTMNGGRGNRKTASHLLASCSF